MEFELGDDLWEVRDDLMVAVSRSFPFFSASTSESEAGQPCDDNTALLVTVENGRDDAVVEGLSRITALNAALGTVLQPAGCKTVRQDSIAGLEVHGAGRLPSTYRSLLLALLA